MKRWNKQERLLARYFAGRVKDEETGNPTSKIPWNALGLAVAASFILLLVVDFHRPVNRNPWQAMGGIITQSLEDFPADFFHGN